MSIVHHIHVQVNPNLAEWFAADPVERIVNLETTLIARKREVVILMMMMMMVRMETTMNHAKKGDMGHQQKKAPIFNRFQKKSQAMKKFPNFDNSTAGEGAIGNNRESVAFPWDPI